MSDGIERTVFAEAKRFVGKDRAKLKLVLGLYALSLKGAQLGKTARASYFFARHLDDLLDGELESIEDPKAYALSLREQIISDDFDADSPIARLVSFAIPALERKAKPEDNPRLEFVQLIDTLLFDHDRARERRTLSSADLNHYYGQVLNPGLNLTLIAFESELRTNNIPDFSPSLGRLYSIRDLSKDWQLGIINIPEEVLIPAGLDASSPYGQVSTNSEVNAWIGQEILDASAVLSSSFIVCRSR